MRKPLSPLQAFAEDARNAADRSADVSHVMVTWLSVAQSADQLSVLNGPTRDEALQQANARLDPFAGERPSMRHDAKPAPTSVEGRVAERFRVVAEAMEKAGCFELAYTTVAAVCRLMARADYVSAALATVHLGRIARQLNDPSTAEDCYSSMLTTCTRERDGPLAARGHIGLALLHDMRGNLPAAEVGYLKALELAVPMGPTAIFAYQGLMTIAIVGGRLADALLYGWQLHDATEDDFDSRTSVLADLSVVALRAGFFVAALRGFEHALGLSQVPRIRLVTLSGAVRAAAQLGHAERVAHFDQETLRDIVRANLPFDATHALLCLAEAFALIGEPAIARARLDEAVSIADRYGYHEYRFRADALAASWEHAPRSQRSVASDSSPVPLVGSRRDPMVDVGIRRLEALSV